MKKPSAKRTSWLVIGIWAINILALVAILVAATFYVSGQPVSGSPLNEGFSLPRISERAMTRTPVPQIDFLPTVTPDPRTLQSKFLPTVTPNPLTTPIIAVTPTTFVLKDGPLPTVIGFSVSGRPLEVYTFGQGEREFMIVAGIHGGYEWNTVALADELIIYINENPQIIPSDATLYILRNMNPDGDARAHDADGRVNDRNVDLNRNFPANWQAEWDREGCWALRNTTSGGPGSEPETRAVMNFLASHRILALISYHSAALGVFPGGEPWETNSTEFAQALSGATKYPFPPIDTGCVYTGTLADYAVSLGTTAVDMELSTHKSTDFDRNLKALQVLLNWGKPDQETK